MTMTHGGYTFGGSSTFHETPQEGDFAGGEDYVHRYFGVEGATEIRGKYHDRIVSIPGRVTANSAANLKALVDTIDGKKGQLNDSTLTVSLTGSNTMSYAHCTFLGFTREGQPTLDGSGVHGWMQTGTFQWRQLKRS